MCSDSFICSLLAHKKYYQQFVFPVSKKSLLTFSWHQKLNYYQDANPVSQESLLYRKQAFVQCYRIQAQPFKQEFQTTILASDFCSRGVCLVRGGVSALGGGLLQGGVPGLGGVGAWVVSAPGGGWCAWSRGGCSRGGCWLQGGFGVTDFFCSREKGGLASQMH